MEVKKMDNIEHKIDQAIMDLAWKFMSIEDYNQAVDAGELVKKPVLTADMEFFL